MARVSAGCSRTRCCLDRDHETLPARSGAVIHLAMTGLMAVRASDGGRPGSVLYLRLYAAIVPQREDFAIPEP